MTDADTARITAHTRRETVPGDGTFDLWDLPTDEASLYGLLEHVFTTYWQHIQFGTLVPGAAWEVRAPNAPTKVGLLDGYVTVDFGSWHFHLCIGPFVGNPDDPLPAELAAARRTAHAELGRRIGTHGPTSWFLRLYTGAGDQQLTVLLPNPFLTDDQRILSEPDWSRLAAWDDLRARYLALEPDPFDRASPGFAHG